MASALNPVSLLRSSLSFDTPSSSVTRNLSWFRNPATTLSPAPATQPFLLLSHQLTRTVCHASSINDEETAAKEAAATGDIGARTIYLKLQDGAVIFSGRPMVARRLRKRAAVVVCATLEEIEAEKSLIEKDVKQRMEKTIETVRSNFGSIRTGRANPAILDRIQVDYYGAPVSLKSIAQISTPDSSSLMISPFDKSSLKAIEKAIVRSELGLTPSNDGEVIRLSIPQLTAERRKELSKVVAKFAEEGKVALRNIRRDALKSYEKLEKDKKISEDNFKDLSGDLQKIIDEYTKKVDSIYKQKEQVFCCL
ncbi:hypothetical protein Dimus_015729 [Dionaea muscipula]